MAKAPAKKATAKKAPAKKAAAKAAPAKASPVKETLTNSALVNLIAGREVVREMIQSQANPDSISEELNRILTDTNYRAKILEGYDQIIKTLDTGSASENAASLMSGYLKGNR